MQRTIALFLAEKSDYQELLRTDAEAAAKRAGLGLDTHYTGPNDFAAQLTKIRECIASQDPPCAILVLAVRDHGLARAVRDAVRAGIAFIYLDRTDDELEDIRTEARDSTGWSNVSEVCADEVETGRIQGRQFRALLPEGGKVLYLQGSTRSLTVRERTRGMQEAVQGSSVDVTLVETGWSVEEARVAMRHRLSLLGRIQSRVDLIGCYTDQIAVGALRALDEIAAELKQPEIAAIRVTGCDATPELGQKLVESGRMVASISLPRPSGLAVDLVAQSLSGKPVPDQVLLKPTSFPVPEAALPPLKRG
jgi:ABC-type sugar transport system substrate-binding protein